MTEPTDLQTSDAYSRHAVEEYLQRVEAERRELEEAIAVARDRTVRATQTEKRILDLELRVGRLVIEAHVQAEHRPAPEPVFTDASVGRPPPPPAGWEDHSG